jgi:hypothetical protein
MTDDFANHPKSISELRSDKSNDARDWTPRDVLIEVLRAIDEKQVDPDAMIVVMRPRSPEGKSVHVKYRVSSPNYHVSLGMLLDAIALFQSDD